MTSRPSTHVIAAARIASDCDNELVISASRAHWTSTLMTALIFVALGAFLISQADSSSLLGVLGILLAVFFLSSSPIRAHLSFAFSDCTARFKADYLLRWPRHIEINASLSQITRVTFQSGLFRKNNVEVILFDGSKFVLNFNQNAAGGKLLVDRFAHLSQEGLVPLLNEPSAVEQARVSEAQALMYQELRSWSIWLFIIGLAQMGIERGFSGWGALLILIGLASFYYREASMFIVYAVTVIWAGINNLLMGPGAWMVFALFQAYIAFVLVKQFRRFREAQVAGSQTVSKASHAFPWLALGFGGMALAVFLLTVVGLFAAAFFGENETFSTLAGGVFVAVVYFAILGIAAGSASLASRYPYKAASITGTVCGALSILLITGLSILGG